MHNSLRTLYILQNNRLLPDHLQLFLLQPSSEDTTTEDATDEEETEDVDTEDETTEVLHEDETEATGDKGKNDQKKTGVKTGDAFAMKAADAGMLISLGMACVVIIRKRRK